jgi:AraC family transcriptional regulator
MQDIERLQRVVDSIESSLSSGQDTAIDIPALADMCHVSPWHFQRLFKSLVGDTLGNYLRGRRLTQAAELLLSSDRSILDIAMQVGFGSNEALSRAFKGYFNLTPKAFRQQSPAVQLNKKPILNPELYHHLANYMQKEPSIIERPEIHLLGFSTQIPSPFNCQGSYCDLLEKSWYQLFEHQQQFPQRQAGEFYGLTISPSGNFDEAEVEYLAAIALKENENVPETLPEGMKHYVLPAQKIAVFDVAQVDEETVGKTMDYIYGYWLPNSQYQRAKGDDYEYFENIDSMESQIPKSKYILPIR